MAREAHSPAALAKAAIAAVVSSAVQGRAVRGDRDERAGRGSRDEPEMEPADFATTGMRLLGWPQDYVRPEYQKQLARVLEQQEAERANRPRDDAEWDRGAGRALSAFLTRGVLPSEERFLPFVLTTCELFALNGHYFGRGGEDLLAAVAFAAIATGNSVERESALQRVGQLQVAATHAKN